MWNISDYCFVYDETETFQPLISSVLRSDQTKPGFCLLSFAKKINSHELRKNMLRVASLFKKMKPVSAGRFNQQENAPFHLDSGAPNNILILGYEPTEVDSTPAIADFHAAANANKVTPESFLNTLNPMFLNGRSLLAPYITSLTNDKKEPWILVINNGKATGVMHAVDIHEVRPNCPRIVNSLMLNHQGGLSPKQLETFLNSDSTSQKFW